MSLTSTAHVLHAHEPNTTIRPATQADWPAVLQLAATAHIDQLSAGRKTFVAEQDSEIVGFIRLVESNGIWYVNPVVVDPSMQRKGIGRQLMQFANKQFGELRFVARGYAVPFYEALSCEPIAWDQIAPIVADDCTECDMQETCFPVPMRMPAQ